MTSEKIIEVYQGNQAVHSSVFEEVINNKECLFHDAFTADLDPEKDQKIKSDILKYIDEHGFTSIRNLMNTFSYSEIAEHLEYSFASKDFDADSCELILQLNGLDILKANVRASDYFS